MWQTPQQANAFLEGRLQSGAQYPEGNCLGSQRDAYGSPATGGTAAIAYSATTHRGAGPAPFGALHWWLGGTRGAGHVAFDCGDGYCLTTDFGPDGFIGDGRIRKVLISSIEANDSLLKYQGWSRDLDYQIVVPLLEDELYVIRKTTVAQKYVYLVDYIRPITDVAVNTIGAVVHTLPDNHWMFGLPQKVPAVLLPPPQPAPAG